MPTRRKEEQQGRGEKVRAVEETEGDSDWKRIVFLVRICELYIF
jgi:hypothetical protein